MKKELFTREGVPYLFCPCCMELGRRTKLLIGEEPGQFFCPRCRTRFEAERRRESDMCPDQPEPQTMRELIDLAQSAGRLRLLKERDATKIWLRYADQTWQEVSISQISPPVKEKIRVWLRENAPQIVHNYQITHQIRSLVEDFFRECLKSKDIIEGVPNEGARLFEGEPHPAYFGPIIRPKQTGKLEHFLNMINFKSEQDRANFIAWLVGFLTRPFEITPTPILFIVSEYAGSGKTTLSHAVAYLLAGQSYFAIGGPDLSSASRQDSVISSATRLVNSNTTEIAIIDNVPQTSLTRPYNPEPLLIWATGTFVAQRQLYTNRKIEVRQKPLYLIANGNKPYLISELISRSLFCELGPILKEQSQEDPKEFVLKNRQAILEDLAYLIENFRQPSDLVQSNKRFQNWISRVAQYVPVYPDHFPDAIKTIRKKVAELRRSRSLDQILRQLETLEDKVPYEDQQIVKEVRNELLERKADLARRRSGEGQPPTTAVD